MSDGMTKRDEMLVNIVGKETGASFAVMMVAIRNFSDLLEEKGILKKDEFVNYLIKKTDEAKKQEPSGSPDDESDRFPKLMQNFIDCIKH